MKPNSLALLLLTSAVVLTGCATRYGTPDRTGTGALTGGAIGAASGAVIGGRNAGAGALIGGAVGAVTGGLIGNAMDRDAQARLQQQAPQTYTRVDQGRPLSVADVKALATARVSDDVILSQIRSTRTSFQLSSADLIDLKNAGVSDRVVEAMINTPPPSAGNAPPDQVVVAGPPPPPRVETVVVAPGPGYVWIDGEWIWNGRWLWVAGHWLAPPYPHAVWVRPSWSRGPHGYHRHGGHWR